MEPDPGGNPGVFVCSGAPDRANDTTQDIFGSEISISVSNNFGIDTRGQNSIALNIISENGITFQDSASGSTIRGAQYGIYAEISSEDDDIRDIVITASGKVQGAAENGIDARIANNGNITINTGPEEISGGTRGINARIGDEIDEGSGDITITANGRVQGAIEYGIDARIANNGNITINTGPEEISGGWRGIHAKIGDEIDTGSGDIMITANGRIKSATEIAISARTAKNGNITINTGPEEISGGSRGIYARIGDENDEGSGDITITANGRVQGATGIGVYARIANNGNITINTGPEEISGGTQGIYARIGDDNDEGSGDIAITANGGVRSSTESGIFAKISNNGNITINTGYDEISGESRGIHAEIASAGSGTGSISVTMNGDVTGGSEAGMEIRNGGTNTLNTGNDITISGGTHDVHGGTGNETINNYGTLTMLGDTDLGKGTNAFNNYGVFNSGLTVDLGNDVNLFTNYGIVSVFGDNAFGTTEITGSWVGQSNSTLKIDAVLDDGTSGQRDILKVTGATSGTTLVFVTNQGGEGGLTGRGSTDGIRITEIGGDSFGTFQQGHQVFGGLAEYELVRADAQDWYLQSMQNSINDSAISSVQTPRSLRAFGAALTGSRPARLGGQDSRGGGNAYGLSIDETKVPGSWARTIGGQSESDGTVSGGIYSADSSHEENFWAIQGGFNALTDDDRLSGSIFMHYGRVDADHTNETMGRSAGSTETDAWGSGISVTWLDPRGFYLDGVATITSYGIDMMDSNHDESSTDGKAWSLSGEFGFALGPIREIAMIPRLQLIYQAISIDDHLDAGGNQISYDDEDSLELRVGTTFEVAVEDDIKLYSQLNILHEFLDAPAVAFDGVPLSMGLDNTGYEARFGVKMGLQHAPYSAYAEANYRAPFGDGAKTWSATGGISYWF